jgi:hypothetical protein
MYAMGGGVTVWGCQTSHLMVSTFICSRFAYNLQQLNGLAASSRRVLGEASENRVCESRLPGLFRGYEPVVQFGDGEELPETR